MSHASRPGLGRASRPRAGLGGPDGRDGASCPNRRRIVIQLSTHSSYYCVKKGKMFSLVFLFFTAFSSFLNYEGKSQNGRMTQTFHTWEHLTNISLRFCNFYRYHWYYDRDCVEKNGCNRYRFSTTNICSQDHSWISGWRDLCTSISMNWSLCYLLKQILWSMVIELLW